MAGVLPPWHDGCHGSRVWRGKPPVEQKRPPFGDGPHGSQQGVTPCTPHRAHRARGTREKASWPGFYRRGTTGATARGSGVVNRQLNRKDRHSATGLMARIKGQRGYEITLAFCVAKISKQHRIIPAPLVEYVQCQLLCTVPIIKKKRSSLFGAAKPPNLCRNIPTCISLSLPSANCGGAERR